MTVQIWRLKNKISSKIRRLVGRREGLLTTRKRNTKNKRKRKRTTNGVSAWGAYAFSVFLSRWSVISSAHVRLLSLNCVSSFFCVKAFVVLHAICEEGSFSQRVSLLSSEDTYRRFPFSLQFLKRVLHTLPLSSTHAGCSSSRDSTIIVRQNFKYPGIVTL